MAGRRFLRGGIMKFSRVLNRFCSAIDATVHFFGVFAGILLFVLTPIACYEVVVRKMGSPTIWAFHILSYIQIFMIWFGIAYTQKVHGHVCVDLVTMHLPLTFRVICRVVSSLLCILLSLVLCWKGWSLVWRSYSNHLMTVEELHHPLYWIQIPLVIGAILLVLIFARQLFADIQWLVTKEGKPEGFDKD